MAKLVDEIVINVGNSDDDTLDEIKKLQKELLIPLKIVETQWDLKNPKKAKNGLILSEQTNYALKHCSFDWCLYLQADEVLHEKDAPILRSLAERYKNDPKIEGLLFDYFHFYGSYDVVQQSRSTYRREVRMVKKSANPQSVGDAQSFRKVDGSKLRVLKTQASIFHYGWVRTPEAMKEKTYHFDQLFHGAPNAQDAKTGTPHTGNNYQYKRILGLKPFTSNHPSVMKSRIEEKGWHWDLTHSPLIWSWKDLKKVILDGIETLTGYRFFEYRSYRKISPSRDHFN